MKKYKAIKYRIKPNKGQRIQIEKTFGCTRFVYNHYLGKQTKNHEAGEKFLGKFDCINDCNRILKDEFPWLREVDKFSLTNAIFHLDHAFKRFFAKDSDYPRFKKKSHEQSYTTNITGGNIKVLPKHIQLPKLGKVRAVIHRPVPAGWSIKSATVRKTASGKYYVSVLFEYESQVQEVAPQTFIGLDFSVPKLFVSSDPDVQTDNEFLQNYRKAQKKLAKEQCILSHRQKGSKRYEKQRIKVAKCHEHVANKRNDYLHKVSTGIANQFDAVCVEDIKMRELVDMLNQFRKGMGKYVLDNGFYGFVNMLAYKLEGRGKHLIKIEKDYPSSQLCSKCGHVNSDLQLSERTWTCPACGGTHDRDYNAAVNIRNRGLELLPA